MEDDSEKKLVERCRAGDRSAYTGLMTVYSGRVFAICLAMLGDSHDAEDVAQQVLLKSFTDIQQLRDSKKFGAWISRIAKNVCIDFIRKHKPRLQGVAQRVDIGQSDLDGYSELQAALTRLPEELRLALMLYYFDGRSTKNIATALGISQGAVQTRLCRARGQLRRLLEA